MANKEDKRDTVILDITILYSFCGWPHGILHTSPARLTWRRHYGCQLMFFLPSQTGTAWSIAALPHNKEIFHLTPNLPESSASLQQKHKLHSDGK